MICAAFDCAIFYDLWLKLVYLKYDFPSCAVLLICWLFLILCSHNFFM